MMDKDRINALGEELYTALRSQSTRAPLTEREADITIEDAYHISLHMVNLRLERDGEAVQHVRQRLPGGTNSTRFLAVKRPARAYKTAIETRFTSTMENAKGA